MVRLFVAIDLPSEIKDLIREDQEIISCTKARLNMVESSIIHITLKFIGEVSNEKLDEIVRALSFTSFHPFSLQVNGIEPNHPKKPRVIWCAVDSGGECEKLHSVIENALSQIGILPDERRFTAHATVCRVKESDSSLLKALIPLKEKNYGEVIVRGFTLKRSTLTPDGPVYEDILGVSW